MLENLALKVCLSVAMELVRTTLSTLLDPTSKNVFVPGIQVDILYVYTSSEIIYFERPESILGKSIKNMTT